MNLHDYQGAIEQFARYPQELGLRYAALGLFGEAGEIANQVKKIWRDDGSELTEDRKAKLRDELSDVLWYAVRFAHHREVIVGNLTYEIGVEVDDLGLPAPTDIFEATENLAILAATAVVSNLLEDTPKEGIYVQYMGHLLGSIATIAVLLDTDLERLAEYNVAKLTGRVERNTLQGSGDGR